MGEGSAADCALIFYMYVYGEGSAADCALIFYVCVWGRGVLVTVPLYSMCVYGGGECC